MRAAILTLVILLLSVSGFAALSEPTLKVVTSAELPEQELTLSELNRIFLGKTRTWQHGERIYLTINTEETTLNAFCQSIVRKTPRQFSMYWRKQLYSGHSMLPVQFDSDEQVVNYLAEHPRAIGFVRSSINDPRVKEITITP